MTLMPEFGGIRIFHVKLKGSKIASVRLISENNQNWDFYVKMHAVVIILGIFLVKLIWSKIAVIELKRVKNSMTLCF